MKTWFDRPLGLAGKVVVKGSDAFHPEVRLYDSEKPVAIIPSLAPHLKRGDAETKLDPQKELIVLNKNIATNLNRDTAQSLIAHRINLVIPYFPTFYEDQLEQRSNKKYSKCIADLMRLVISNDQDTTIEKVNKKKFGIKAAISIKKEKAQ